VLRSPSIATEETMSETPKPPRGYQEFIARYPALGTAWDAVNEAGQAGPLDAKTVRLIKIGIAMGAMREGAIRSGARKALAMGITPAELAQVVALAVGTLGFPSTVAIHSWLREQLGAPPEQP
jgi:alkylhydroperoxidase/carboxymuconolactone decarboxylase family protein YurZ